MNASPYVVRKVRGHLAVALPEESGFKEGQYVKVSFHPNEKKVIIEAVNGK